MRAFGRAWSATAGPHPGPLPHAERGSEPTARRRLEHVRRAARPRPADWLSTAARRPCAQAAAGRRRPHPRHRSRPCSASPASAMDAQLMGAPVLPAPELKPGDRLGRVAGQHLASTRQSVSAVCRFGCIFIHQPRLSSSRPRAGRSRRYPPPARRRRPPSRFADLALLEQKPQFFQGFVVTPEDKAAGGVAIEAAPRRAPQPRSGAPVRIVLEAGPALRPRMNRDASRRGRASNRRDEQPRSSSSGVMRTMGSRAA